MEPNSSGYNRPIYIFLLSVDPLPDSSSTYLECEMIENLSVFVLACAQLCVMFVQGVVCHELCASGWECCACRQLC